MRAKLKQVVDERPELIAQMLRAAADLAIEQRWTSYSLMSELEGNKRPHVEIRGRWQTDPINLIGQLAVVKERLARMVVDERDASNYG